MPKRIKKIKKKTPKPIAIKNKNKLNNKIQIHIDNSRKTVAKSIGKSSNNTSSNRGNYPHIIYLNNNEIPRNVFTNTIEPKKIEIPKEVIDMSPLAKRTHEEESEKFYTPLKETPKKVSFEDEFEDVDVIKTPDKILNPKTGKYIQNTKANRERLRRQQYSSFFRRINKKVLKEDDI